MFARICETVTIFVIISRTLISLRVFRYISSPEIGKMSKYHNRRQRFKQTDPADGDIFIWSPGAFLVLLLSQDTNQSKICPTNPSTPLSIVETFLSLVDDHRKIEKGWSGKQGKEFRQQEFFFLLLLNYKTIRRKKKKKKQEIAFYEHFKH